MKPPKHRASTPDEGTPGVRLNKYIANAGICSRRKADELIAKGLVTVSGKVVREMGYRVMPGEPVYYQGKEVVSGKKVYILLNKPKDTITTTSDPQGRKTVIDLVKKAGSERIYPVGRLDRNTTGLLLLTNDGELSQDLAHPSKKVKKIYHVHLDKPLTKKDFEKIQKGISLEEGTVKVDDLAYPDPSEKSNIGIEIHIGWNRVIRRIFESLGYRIKRLDRVIYAGLTKKDLPRGKWRFLTKKEVIWLKSFT